MSRAYLSLGSNEQPQKKLRAALDELRTRFGHIVVSPVYRTRAVGFDGPDFYNLAVALDTDLAPAALNEWLHALEDRQGPFVKGFRFLVLAKSVQERGQGGDIGGHIGVIGSQRLFADGH